MKLYFFILSSEPETPHLWPLVAAVYKSGFGVLNASQMSCPKLFHKKKVPPDQSPFLLGLKYRQRTKVDEGCIFIGPPDHHSMYSDALLCCWGGRHRVGAGGTRVALTAGVDGRPLGVDPRPSPSVRGGAQRGGGLEQSAPPYVDVSAKGLYVTNVR